MTRETWFQSQVKSYQRLKKWYLMPPCLTLSIVRYGSRVKWVNPGKGVAPSPTPWCSSYWKWNLRVTLDYGCQLYWSYNSWIHITSRGISAMWNGNNLVQDLNLGSWIHFLKTITIMPWAPPILHMAKWKQNTWPQFNLYIRILWT